MKQPIGETLEDAESKGNMSFPKPVVAFVDSTNIRYKISRSLEVGS